MDTSEIKPIVEAMIFVSEEPITETGMMIALEPSGVERAVLKGCIRELETEWNDNPSRGMMLANVAGGYQFRTKEACANWLKNLSVPKPMRLSSPSLETLAIVAYKQPIVRSEIEKIRGVDSGGVLKTLLERRLLRIVGRRDEPGQPLLYGTTKEFLEIFNLRNLTELPTLKDVEELLREHRTKTHSANVVSTEGSEEGEEPTEVISAVEEEEETELIRRYPLDEDVEAESKDMEALDDLEHSLKSLRRLEKDIFPKPKLEIELGGIDVQSPGFEGAAEASGQGETVLEGEIWGAREAGEIQKEDPGCTAAADEASGEDEAEQADRARD